jgi:hypothetical protein
MLANLFCRRELGAGTGVITRSLSMSQIPWQT